MERLVRLASLDVMASLDLLVPWDPLVFKETLGSLGPLVFKEPLESLGLLAPLGQLGILLIKYKPTLYIHLMNSTV
jgi:hypothetical protein